MDAPFLNVVVRADSFPLFRAMFVHTGACHSVADDRELNVLMTVSSTMGPFYYTLAAIRDFVTSKERQGERVALICFVLVAHTKFSL